MAVNPITTKLIAMQPSKRKLAAIAARKKVNADNSIRKGVPSAVNEMDRQALAVTIPKSIPSSRVVEEKATLGLSYAARKRIREIAIERYKRRNEALRLWTPMPQQLAFHSCRAYERSVIGSNRSGKTTCAAVDVALIGTGQHEYLSGSRMKKSGGRCAIVGFDWDHIGRVNYKKLFMPGAFKIIRDLVTGKWRPYRPSTDEDRKREAKDAPPLIPKRLIKKIAWKSKALGQPKLIILKNGWEFYFFSSEGEPPQGDSYDLVWFDEEIQNQKWYTEVAMRLADVDGLFIWSATPHVGGDDLIDLHNRSIEQLTHENPTTREFHLTLFGNTHISDTAKARVAEKFKNNPEAYRVRVLGEFAAKALRVYADYTPSIHNFDPKKVWEKTGGQCPEDWCKYISVDPGKTVCAVVFMAVPPPKFGENYYFYKECYIEDSNPRKFADVVEFETRNSTYEVFYMDMQAGRSRQTSGGKSVEELYSEALQACGPEGGVNVWTRLKERAFWPGAADLDAGIDEVRSALIIDHTTGTPRMLVAENRLPHLEQEMDRYQYVKKDGRITDKPRDKWHHVLDNVRYLITARPTWQQPKPVPKQKSLAVQRFMEKKKRAMANNHGGVVNFGPGSSVFQR